MNFDIYARDLIESIRNDYVNGSLTIAKKALFGLIKIIENEPFQDVAKYKSLIYELKNTKPSMSALQNSLNRVLGYFYSTEPNNLVLKLNELINLINNSTDETIEKAIKYIVEHFPTNYKIITASFSSTFVKFVQRLNLGSNLEVYSLQSKWQKFDYSVQLVQELETIGVNAKVVGLNNIGNNLDLSFAMIGADCVVQNYGVVNGIPSKRLAEFCSISEIPFFVISESIKFSDSCIEEDGFEFIEKEFITKIFSDNIFKENNYF